MFDDEIKINPNWQAYLFDNIRLLKDFCYWNLTLFLQSKNPNVPDIPNKLIKPAIRSGLSGQRKNFWDIVINELGSIDCLYTGEKLTIGNYAVEHFIPFAFVSHDLIWNLVPADKPFNSSKSDKLPSLDTYFDAFFKLQAEAIEIVQIAQPNNRYLEDYLTIFPDLGIFNKGLIDNAKQKYKDQLQPLITIASNNGFEFLNGIR